MKRVGQVMLLAAVVASPCRQARADEPTPDPDGGFGLVWLGVGVAGCGAGFAAGYGIYDAATVDAEEDSDGYVWSGAGGCGIGALLFAGLPMLVIGALGDGTPNHREVALVPRLDVDGSGVRLTWVY